MHFVSRLSLPPSSLSLFLVFIRFRFYFTYTSSLELELSRRGAQLSTCEGPPVPSAPRGSNKFLQELVSSFSSFFFFFPLAAAEDQPLRDYRGQGAVGRREGRQGSCVPAPDRGRRRGRGRSSGDGRSAPEAALERRRHQSPRPPRAGCGGVARGEPREGEAVPRGHRGVRGDGEVDRRGERVRRRRRWVFGVLLLALVSSFFPVLLPSLLCALSPSHRQRAQPRRKVQRLRLRGHAREVEQQEGVRLVRGVQRRRSGGGRGGRRRRGRRLRRRRRRRPRGDDNAVTGKVGDRLQKLAPVPRTQGRVRARGGGGEAQRRREPGTARDERLAEPPEARDEPRPL